VEAVIAGRRRPAAPRVPAGRRGPPDFSAWWYARAYRGQPWGTAGVSPSHALHPQLYPYRHRAGIGQQAAHTGHPPTGYRPQPWTYYDVDTGIGWAARAIGMGATFVKPPATAAPKPPSATPAAATTSATREPTNGRHEGAWIALLVLLAAARRARRH